MARRGSRASRSPLTFDEARQGLEQVLRGPARREIVDAFLDGADAATSLARLRHAMGAHAFPAPDGTLSFRRIVDALDARTRREGLHVLHGWDFRAQRRPADIAPVLLLDYCGRLGVPADRTRTVVATLLDQYFLALLALLTVRAWDDGDVNANVDAVTSLIGQLHGADGSGECTVDDAETLLMLAVSYYHPEEAAYDHLLDRVRGLDEVHRLRLAFPCASIIGSHLRWGLRFMYKSDIGLMRADNVVDYPWSLFALLTLMRAYDRAGAAPADAPGRLRLAGAILDGLSPDPSAFDGPAPAFLAPHGEEHAALRELLHRHRDALIADFDRLRPSAAAYSPLAFSCNFLSNAVVATVATGLGDAHRHPSLNALLEHDLPGNPAPGAASGLAEHLMQYAAGNTERLAKGGAPLIVHDRHHAAHVFNAVVRVLRHGDAGA